jgi:hypothetical protein
MDPLWPHGCGQGRLEHRWPGHVDAYSQERTDRKVQAGQDRMKLPLGSQKRTARPGKP